MAFKIYYWYTAQNDSGFIMQFVYFTNKKIPIQVRKFDSSVFRAAMVSIRNCGPMRTICLETLVLPWIIICAKLREDILSDKKVCMAVIF